MNKSIIKKTKMEKGIKYLVLCVLLIVFFVGNLCKIENIALAAVVGIFLFNIIENLVSSRRSLFYIMFHGFIFLFILDRPIIAFFRGDVWAYFSHTTVYIALFVLFLSFAFLNIGFYYQNKTPRKRSNLFERLNAKIGGVADNQFTRCWFWITLITLGCSLIKEGINMLHFSNYADIYMGVQVDIPIIITLFAGISAYCMFFYLATLPSKIKVIIVLGLYLLTGIPGIVTGGRNALMIKVLFCFIYFVLRECMERNSKWIGKKEIIAVLVMIPVAMVALGVLNYTREGASVETISPIEIGEDFLYKQGTSFDTLCQTIQYRGALRDDNYINYTFGEFIDFINYNKLSNVIFGTLDFGDGNNIYSGTLSNKLAHRVSYLALGDSYLAGHGRGTTYFSEVYLDFGYLGIVIFNFAIGIFLAKIVEIFKKGFLQRGILLNCLLYFFIIPRLSFFSIFSFSISYYWWFFIVLCIFVYICFSKRKGRR